MAFTLYPCTLRRDSVVQRLVELSPIITQMHPKATARISNVSQPWGCPASRQMLMAMLPPKIEIENNRIPSLPSISRNRCQGESHRQNRPDSVVFVLRESHPLLAFTHHMFHYMNKTSPAGIFSHRGYHRLKHSSANRPPEHGSYSGLTHDQLCRACCAVNWWTVCIGPPFG